MTASAPTIPTMLHAYELTDAHKAEFIKLIYEGHKPDAAARHIGETGSTGTQFRRLRNPSSEHYDPDFAKAYKDAITSEEHRSSHLERIRDAVWQAAENGNARILEKLSLIYDPDWEPLRNANLNVNVQMLARVVPYFSTEELERAIAKAEAEQVEAPRTLRALPEPKEAE